MLYDEKIERLIELALADGVLTDKERTVLCKKAQEAGIDLDEFEMVLEARIVEHNKKNAPTPPPMAAPAPVPARNSGKQGGVVKCPSCGAIVPSMTAVCAECGHEFRNIDAVQSAQRMFEALQEVERLKADAIRTSPNKIASIEKQFHDQRLTIIRTFPVPNSKEDLIEMLAMTSSNAYDNDGVVGTDEEAWLQKTDQVYQKIVITFANDNDTLKRATSMVASLMRRLPSKYKNFTNLPASMREHALQETDQAKKQISDYRNQKSVELLKSPLTLSGIGGIILGIIFMSVAPDGSAGDFLAFLGLVMFIVGIVLTRKAYKQFKEIRKTDGMTL